MNHVLFRSVLFIRDVHIYWYFRAAERRARDRDDPSDSGLRKQWRREDLREGEEPPPPRRAPDRAFFRGRESPSSRREVGDMMKDVAEGFDNDRERFFRRTEGRFSSSETDSDRRSNYRERDSFSQDRDWGSREEPDGRFRGRGRGDFRRGLTEELEDRGREEREDYRGGRREQPENFRGRRRGESEDFRGRGREERAEFRQEEEEAVQFRGRSLRSQEESEELSGRLRQRLGMSEDAPWRRARGEFGDDREEGERLGCDRLGGGERRGSI